MVTDTTRAKMSHSQSAAHLLGKRDETNWKSAEGFKLREKARLSENPEEQVVDPEDLYLPPMKSDQPDGTFVAGGDLWREVD